MHALTFNKERSCKTKWLFTTRTKKASFSFVITHRRRRSKKEEGTRGEKKALTIEKKKKMRARKMSKKLIVDEVVGYTNS